MKLKLSKKSISTTMLISMTDVVFLLIIFLLIVSNFSSQTGLPIRLPGSVSGVRHTIDQLNISYFQDGTLYYNQEKVSREELSERLKMDFESTAQVVRLSAEENTPLSEVISIMDIIRFAGYDKIFVATEVITK